jgi:hypothetical protein
MNLNKKKSQKNKVLRQSVAPAPINLVFVPVSVLDYSDPIRLEEIQNTAAKIILLSTRRGRPAQNFEDESNAA